jgi:hypothetical protein
MKIEKKTSSKLSEIPSPQTMTRQARDNCKVVPSEFSIAMTSQNCICLDNLETIAIFFIATKMHKVFPLLQVRLFSMRPKG